MEHEKASDIVASGADSSTSIDKERTASSNNVEDRSTAPDSSGNYNYELVGDYYYYTDEVSGIRYKFNQETQSWEDASNEDDPSSSQTAADSSTKTNSKDFSTSVTTDEDGRQYYYADGMYLCRNPQGDVFYMDKNNDWKPWSDKGQCDSTVSNTSLKWQYYKDGETFYRDNSNNKVYKLNKETNEWEEYVKKRKKRKREANPDEEFDTDDDEQSFSEEEGDDTDSAIPPGFNSDPNIKYNGQIYTKYDPSDNMTYEWDHQKKAWFPKVSRISKADR